MDYEAFYLSVAELLGVDYETKPVPQYRESLRHDGTIRNSYKNRWNGRIPGNGRFTGHGIVRAFGTTIHVSLYSPSIIGYFDGPDAALSAIKAALQKG